MSKTLETSTTPLTVTELTAQIKQMLERGFSNIELYGEVSRLTRHASGHLYFTIKDRHASISAVVWRSTAMRLRCQPEEGDAFIFSGHLSLYEPRGSYQLVISRIEIAGAGRLAAEFERRKQRLAQQGWFDPQRKQLPSPLPRHIGIITSPTAAALGDAKKVLRTRPGWLQITLSPCLVQGNNAATTIITAIERICHISSPPDLLLLIRGGGSMEDLWCFNDEQLVKTIANCPIPIITGIGHEIDTTLADLAADIRAATPSNAAELSCPASHELHERLPRMAALATLLQRHIQQLRQQHHHLKQQQHTAWQRSTDHRHHSSEQLQSQLTHHMHTTIQQQKHLLHRLQRRLIPLQPSQKLQQQRWQATAEKHALRQALKSTIDQKRGNLTQHIEAVRIQKMQIRLKQQKLMLATGKLRELSPMQVLQRGYCFGRKEDGSLITEAASLQKGEHIELRFHDGIAISRVESINTAAQTGKETP